MNLDNDGLWYQGDSPRHAMNGLFWIDFLQSGSLHPKQYALEYYARYPAINPVPYPPLFYLLEGAAFAVCGPSPYVAKSLVLLFALMAAIYLLAWLRRWVLPEVGWAAALLLLTPGLVTYSHVVLLNVPALAWNLAALYHARSWLESRAPSSLRRLYLVVGMCLLGILTYYPVIIGLLVIPAWFVFFGRRKALHRARMLVAGLVSLLLLAPAAWVAVKWAPIYVSWLNPIHNQTLNIANWAYYGKHLPKTIGTPLLVLAIAGIVAGLATRRWRREIGLLLVWLAVTYVAFSMIQAKEERYVLSLLLPLIACGTISTLLIIHWLERLLRVPANLRGLLFAVAITIAVGAQGWQSSHKRIPDIKGFKEVVAYLKERAPDEPVLYDGHHDGVFVFYMRAGDPHFRQQVVLGSKLLYAFALVRGWRMQEFASTQDEVVEILRTRGGCKWLVLEMNRKSNDLAPARRLRNTVQRQEFKLMASFPIHDGDSTHIDVYRLQIPVDRPEAIDLSFPILGKNAQFRVTPIPPKR
jgi:hypothetical protein